MSSTQPFFIKNCFLAAIATGEKAGSLLEFREKIATIDEGCLYYHFWGTRMSPQYIHEQHHNDFANWAFHRLHDHVLAEKLSIIDPTEFETLEQLRHEILETLDERLEDYDLILSTKRENRFHFIWSSIIVVNSTYTINQPKDFIEVIEKLPPSSIFYHFIDARRRTVDKIDDFSTWLNTFNSKYKDLIESFQAIDPYFLTLIEVKHELIKAIQKYFKAHG